MMRAILRSAPLLVLLFLLPSHLRAQDDVKDQVVQAIGAGDATGLAKHFVPSVDLTVLTTSEYYSKAQAEQILRKFFSENAPRGMVIEHDGTGKVGDRYYIGKLRTATGEFRVTFFLKRAEVFQVKQLRIEQARGGQ